MYILASLCKHTCSQNADWPIRIKNSWKFSFKWFKTFYSLVLNNRFRILRIDVDSLWVETTFQVFFMQWNCCVDAGRLCNKRVSSSTDITRWHSVQMCYLKWFWVTSVSPFILSVNSFSLSLLQSSEFVCLEFDEQKVNLVLKKMAELQESIDSIVHRS